jgi:predicted DNA-binding transcriptional regulator AlpA
MTQGLAQPEPERLLSADELASFLGMSLDWVYERAKARDLPSLVLPGGRRKFRYSEVRSSGPVAGVAWRRFARGAGALRFAGATGAGNVAARSRGKLTLIGSRSRSSGRRSSGLCTRRSPCSSPTFSTHGLSGFSSAFDRQRMRAACRHCERFASLDGGEFTRFERQRWRIGLRRLAVGLPGRRRSRCSSSSRSSGVPSKEVIASTPPSSACVRHDTRSGSLDS